MRLSSCHNRRKVLVLFLFLVLSIPSVFTLTGVPFMPSVKHVVAQPWAPLPASWMNVTGGSGSQSWIFRVGYPPNPLPDVHIEVSGVEDFFSWEFKLRWNASLLSFNSVTEGDFLSGGGSTTFYSDVFEDDVGWDYILVNCTLQSGSGVSGSGRIATVSFNAQTSGQTSLDLYETEMMDSGQSSLSHAVTDGCALIGDFNGYPMFYVVPQMNIANPGEMFNVTVWIDQVEDLFMWDFTLNWAPFYLLTATDIVDRNFLQGNSFFTSTTGVGWASATATLVGESSGTSGSGPLATIMLQVSPYYLGKTFLNFTDTKLRAVIGEPPEFIDIEEYATFGGFFRTSKPRADFTFSPERPAANITTVLFDATGSGDPVGGNITSYHWNFKDGTNTTTSDPTITHIFQQPGKYYVNLTVTDDEGETGTTENPVTVVIRDIAITKFAISHKAAMPGTLVNVTVSVKNNGTGYGVFDSESFETAVYVSNQTINVPLGTEAATLAEDEVADLSFTWDTTGYDAGAYTIDATVLPLIDENYEDNNDANATITIGSVNIVDYPVQIGGLTKYIRVESNSTLPYPPPFEPTSFYYNQTGLEIGLNVTGPSDASSYCNVTVPKTLLRSEPLDAWEILFDDVPVLSSERAIAENDTHTTLYFNYTLSEHKIRIIGTIGPGVPIASFTLSPIKDFVFIGDIMIFNASASYDVDGYIADYFFDFGDDSNATGTPNYEGGTGKLLNVSWVFKEGAETFAFTTPEPVLNHTFKKKAILAPFKIMLTATDNLGFSSTDSQTLKVFWPFDMTITAIDTSATSANIGEILTINVTITNKLDHKGLLKCNLTILGNDEALTPEIAVELASPTGASSGTSVSVGFDWNTTNVALGTYNLKASVEVTHYDLLQNITDSPPELTTDDNTLVYGDVIVKKWDSILDMDVSTTTTTVGSPVIVEGTLSPIRAGANVTIQSKLGEADWSDIVTLTVSVQGQYFYSWTPTAAGTYQVRAMWLGDTITSANMSSVETLTVAKLGSTISLAANPTSVNLGSNVTLSGRIQPTRSNVQVTIYAREEGGGWTELAATQTDDQGNYSFEWEPTEAGTYEFQARWAGDANTLQSESDVKQVQVEAAEGLPMDVIYAAVGIAIIVVAGIAFYLRRRGKQE